MAASSISGIAPMAGDPVAESEVRVAAIGTDPDSWRDEIIKANGGKMILTGTSGRDLRRIDIDPDNSSYARVTEDGGVAFSVKRLYLKSIEFRGYGGDDEFVNNTDYPCTVWGGGGNDKIIGGNGKDKLHGGSDPLESLQRDDGEDLIEGRGGDDEIWGDDGVDTLIGGDGHDTLHGGYGNDVMFGDSELEGHDDGDDWIYGGVGDDAIIGGGGVDRIYGEDGRDIIRGGSGNDVLVGGAGTDRLYGELGRDALNGYPGPSIPDRSGDLLDWGPLPVLRFKQTKVAVDEGQIAKVIIERVPRDTDLIESTVNVRTTNITTSSNDFVPGSGLVIDYGNWDVVFQGGETEKALVWSLRQDGIVEKDEQFIVELTDVDMAVIDSATDTVAVTVHDENHSPIARNDGPVNVVAGTTVTIRALANDEDPDGDPISILRTNQGKASADGRSISYTAPGRTGLDRLSYTIQDPAGATATATVAIRVTNDAPAATPDDGTTRRDVPVEIDVLRNDRDPDGHTLRVVEFTQGRHGTVTAGQGPDGNILMYTPDLRYFKYGESGSDEFRYTVSDGYGGEATAGVKIWIVKNHEPTARDDEATVQFNKSGEIDVLKNDFDLDGDDITVTWTSKPAHGTVVQKTVNGKRLLAYTPAQGATADDQFTYRVSDGHGGSDEAVVRIKINRPPVAVPDDRSTVHNRPIEIPVLGNDTDPDQNPLHVARYTTASAREGTVRLKGSDLVVYTPSKNFVGTDQLQYTVSDGRGGEATTVVNIEVTNASPVTQLDRVSFTTASANGGEVKRKGPNRPNVLIYNPRPGFVGTDQLQYTISDGKGGTATTVVNLVVKAAAATQKSAISNTGNVMHPLLTDQILADGADWRRGSQELDEAIRLLALERR